MLENSDTNMTNIKFILACYEAMSGMKINYERSEVFMIWGVGGVEAEEKMEVAELFGRRV